MRKEPYSVRILVADGDPEGIRIVEQPNWSGTGIVFPRLRWCDARERSEFDAAGVYLLVGEPADGGLPTIAIGGGAPLREQIDAALDGPVPWSWGVAFASRGDWLGAGHICRIVFALRRWAANSGRCQLHDDTLLPEPSITEREAVEARAFLDELLRILPLLGLRVFVIPKDDGVSP